MERHNELHQSLTHKLDTYIENTDEIIKVIIMLADQTNVTKTILDKDREKMLQTSEEAVTQIKLHATNSLATLNSMDKKMDVLVSKMGKLCDLIIKLKTKLNGANNYDPTIIYGKLDDLLSAMKEHKEGDEELKKQLESVVGLHKKKMSVWMKLLEKAGPYVILILAALAAFLLSFVGINVKDFIPK